jgi:RND family efflux transporter MFP subunit
MLRLVLGISVLAGVSAVVFVPAAGQAPVGREQAVTAQDAPRLSELVVARNARIDLDERAVLASDRPGLLQYVEFGEGDRVTAGQEIARLRDDVAAAALAVAAKAAESDIEIRYAEAAAAVAEAEHRRSLLANQEAQRRGVARDRDLIPEVEIERLRLAAERARLQIEKARLDREIALLQRDEKEAELRTYRIISPLDGVVTEVLKYAGEAVQQGDPIVRLVRTDVVRVEGFVSVADAFRVRPGDAVTVRLNAEEIEGLPSELSNRVFEGRLTFVDPTAKLVANMVRVWATVPNEGNLLKAGLPATMEIRPTGDLSTALGAALGGAAVGSAELGTAETRP